MAAIGTVWESGSWADDTWAAGSWDDIVVGDYTVVTIPMRGRFAPALTDLRTQYRPNISGRGSFTEAIQNLRGKL